MAAAIGEKRAIDHVAASSWDLASKKGKTESIEKDEVCPDLGTIIKTLQSRHGRTESDDDEEKEDCPANPDSVIKSLDECPIDDDATTDRIYSEAYWHSKGYYKSFNAREDKIHIKEYQLFFISIGQLARATQIQSLKDIHEKVTRNEQEQFDKKGWSFNPRTWKPCCDYYDYLFINPRADEDDSLYTAFYEFENSYKGDLHYDEFYSAVLKIIESCMSLEEAYELAQEIRCESFQCIDADVGTRAAHECFSMMKQKEELAERIKLLSCLWVGIVNDKKDFKEVVEEIYKDKDSYLYPTHKNAIEDALQLGDRSVLKYMYDGALSSVHSSWARSLLRESRMDVSYLLPHKDVRALLWRILVYFFFRGDPAYGDYARRKIRVAKRLGIARESGVAFQ